MKNQSVSLKFSNDFMSLESVSELILSELMNYRRLPKNANSCGNSRCKACREVHLKKILSHVESNLPVTLVLPAFPGKSPNANKVLGHLPDLAEILSLNFLGELCKRIKNFYSPGIKIILCSDGRVFSDVVGMKETHVTLYQKELDRLIKDLSLTDITTYNLDNYYNNLSFNQMRDELMKTFGNSSAFLKDKIRRGAKAEAKPEEVEAHRMYLGITRFLFEDALHPDQTQSRASLQRDAKLRAYEVIRRSNAWSELIEKIFPEAIRLSIHPQTCGAKKLGIRLIGNESWMTPWHGVAVKTNEGFILLKKSEAISKGAKLMRDLSGRASHFVLNERSLNLAYGSQYELQN